jgi:hypothetical protein
MLIKCDMPGGKTHVEWQDQNTDILDDQRDSQEEHKQPSER